MIPFYNLNNPITIPYLQLDPETAYLLDTMKFLTLTNKSVPQIKEEEGDNNLILSKHCLRKMLGNSLTTQLPRISLRLSLVIAPLISPFKWSKETILGTSHMVIWALIHYQKAWVKSTLVWWIYKKVTRIKIYTTCKHIIFRGELVCRQDWMKTLHRNGKEKECIWHQLVVTKTFMIFQKLFPKERIFTTLLQGLIGQKVKDPCMA